MRRVRATPDDLKKPRRSSPFRHDPLLEDLLLCPADAHPLRAAQLLDFELARCQKPQVVRRLPQLLQVLKRNVAQSALGFRFLRAGIPLA